MKETPLIRHAPDKNNYHAVDATQAAKMSGGRVGDFAVIPSASKNGVSHGFDPTIGGEVCIDPGEEGGGAIFNPNAVTAEQIQAAVASAETPHDAYYRLSTLKPNTVNVRTQRNVPGTIRVDTGINPIMPGSYVVPHVDNNPLTHLNTQEESFSVSDQTPRYAQPQPEPQVGPDLASTLLAMQTQIAALSQRVAPQPVLPSVTGMSATPLPVYANKKNPRKDAEAESYFSSLLVPFLVSDQPVKPKQRVAFELPNAGRISASYHDAIIGDNCVILVYDTRFEHGMQYVPPDMRQQFFPIHLLTQRKTFNVAWMSLKFTMGVLDFMVFVIAPEEQNVVNYQDTDDQDDDH